MIHLIAGLTKEAKVEKFDGLMTEYYKLLAYRHSLAGMVISNIDSIMEERIIKQHSILLIQVDRKLDPQSIKTIQDEIKRVDFIISFLNNVIFGDEKVKFESKINDTYVNNNITNENEITGTG
jgi:hypothetical protein